MRGQSKQVKSLNLSGKVYLRHYHEEELKDPMIGDICLYIFDEEKYLPILLNDYQIKGYKGYFKVQIYDGQQWCFLDSVDFFPNKENYFAKHEISLFTFNFCQDILDAKANTTVYRSYREHYTTYLHEAGEYKGKKTIKPK